MTVFHERFVRAIRKRIDSEFAGKISAHDVVDSGLRAAVASECQFAGTTESEFCGWLWAIVQQNLQEKVRRLRTEKRNVAREKAGVSDLAASAVQVGPAEEACLNELRSTVLECINELPTAQREAMILMGLREKTRREAAAELGVSEGTVAGLYRRGLSALNTAIKTALYD